MTDIHESQTPLARIGSFIGKIEAAFGMLSLVVILVLVFFQALQRHLPIPQIAWTGEISRFSLLWLTFIAAGLLVSSDGHIALEVLDTMKNKRAVKFVHVFSLAMLTLIGLGLTLEAYALVTTQIVKSPVLSIPMAWVYIPVLIGAASLTIRAALATVGVIRNGPRLSDHYVDEVEVVAP
ncbi:MAG: TRAP transporter small permease [bacterium]|nr:TRAP transporter small permease [bacterium]